MVMYPVTGTPKQTSLVPITREITGVPLIYVCVSSFAGGKTFPLSQVPCGLEPIPMKQI